MWLKSKDFAENIRKFFCTRKGKRRSSSSSEEMRLIPIFVFTILCLDIFDLTLLPKVNGASFVCPDEREIFPCSCEVREKRREILTCKGDLVTQESIDHLFFAVRQANNISTSDSFPPSSSDVDKNPKKKNWLSIHLFQIRHTPLTTVDVTPFTKINFTIFDLSNNYELTSIAGPLISLSIFEEPKINNFENKTETSSEEKEETQTASKSEKNSKEIRLLDQVPASRFIGRDVRLDFCSFGDTEVGNLVMFLEPKMVKKLSLARNRVQGSQGHNQKFKEEIKELIPGLSTLTHLQYLSLHGNLIRRITRGQFKYNGRLIKLDLSFNQISELGEDAFYQEKYLQDDNNLIPLQDKSSLSLLENSLVDEVPAPSSAKVPTYKPLVIDLASNKLTDDFVHPRAFPFLHRTTFVSFNDNQFRTLSPETFTEILVDFDAYFSFLRNPIVCDDGLRWLRDRRRMLDKFFWGVNCANDVGHDVFTTKLIRPPGSSPGGGGGGPNQQNSGKRLRRSDGSSIMDFGIFGLIRQIVGPYFNGYRHFV